MKVLHILNYVGRGGSETYIKNLAMSSNISHELIYNVDGGGLEAFNELGIKTTQLSMKSAFDISAAKFIKRYAEENGIDIIHTHFMRENGIAYLAKLLGSKTKTINTRHMLTKLTKMQSFVNRIFFSANSAVIAVSSKVKKSLISEGLKERKIVCIAPPVLLEDAPSIAHEGEKWLVSVGRLSEEKGCIFFVDALKELFKLDCAKDYKAIIIGYGDLESAMKERIKAYNLEERVLLLGYQKPYAYLKSAQIYVNHSKEEAFGLSIAEAANLGAALLIEENVGATDYFNEESRTALSYKYGDVQGFTDKAERLMKDAKLREELRENARNVARRELSREKILSDIERIYKGAIYEKK